MSNHRLIFGCGYVGERVAKRWLSDGDRVTVVTRNAERAETFAKEGYETLVADVTEPASLDPIKEAACSDVATLLYAVGYDRSAEASIDEVYAQGFQNVLDRLTDTVERVVYISTTGVYGSAKGDWVDETTPPAPQRDGGRASLAAEQNLLASSFADRGVILRLAGIYGPDRLPYLKKLMAGEPIAAPQSGYLNLIHVDDAAKIVTEFANPNSTAGLYCVSDGNPPVRSDYYAEVARLLSAPAPSYCDPPADSPRAARAGADKRVSNQRLLSKLGGELLYPSHREGLAAIIE